MALTEESDPPVGLDQNETSDIFYLFYDNKIKCALNFDGNFTFCAV